MTRCRSQTPEQMHARKTAEIGWVTSRSLVQLGCGDGVLVCDATRSQSVVRPGLVAAVVQVLRAAAAATLACYCSRACEAAAEVCPAPRCSRSCCDEEALPAGVRPCLRRHTHT